MVQWFWCVVVSRGVCSGVCVWWEQVLPGAGVIMFVCCAVLLYISILLLMHFFYYTSIFKFVYVNFFLEKLLINLTIISFLSFIIRL